ncbi:MAG: hypothetical protein L0271_16315 [Gemmatimonadetes bacterium]|nr:hypothetical protein [Gemmatimonadota bacterium]
MESELPEEFEAESEFEVEVEVEVEVEMAVPEGGRLRTTLPCRVPVVT